MRNILEWLLFQLIRPVLWLAWGPVSRWRRLGALVVLGFAAVGFLVSLGGLFALADASEQAAIQLLAP
jgi:hypothetical protein